MVGRGDDHRVDARLFIQQLAIIVIRSWHWSTLDLQRTITLPLIDIANGDDLLIDFGEFRDQVTSHLATHPNARKRQSLVGRLFRQYPDGRIVGRPTPIAAAD